MPPSAASGRRPRVLSSRRSRDWHSAGDAHDAGPDLVRGPAAAEPAADGPGASGPAAGRGRDRRRAGEGAPRRDDSGGVPRPRARHPHAVLPRDADARQRLPHMRGRGDRLPRAGPGLLAPRGARDDDPHRIRARAPVAPDGPRTAGFLRRSLDGARRRSPDDSLRCPPRALRATQRGRGPGRAGRARAPPDPSAPPSAAGARGERDAREPGHHEAPDGAQAETVAQPVKIDNDLYLRDYSKCILCYKCVEACGVDAQNTFAIAVAGRGFGAAISTEADVPLPESACVYCGNCIGVCPTGALMFKSEHDLREAGDWREEEQSTTDTICPYCGVGCTLTVHVQDDRIIKVTSPL